MYSRSQTYVNSDFASSSVITLLLTFDPGASDKSCKTPHGQDGTCTPINQCQAIFSLFQNPSLSPTTAIFLRKSRCDPEEVYPKVCCPIGPSTPPPIEKNKLLPEVCGNEIQSRIFGGEVTQLDEFPWMALLEYQIKGKRTLGCGGALINKRYVVTARHCIKEYLVSVRLGEYNTNTDPDCVTNSLGKDCNHRVLNLGIEEKVSHSGSGDIALLRLDQDVQFTDFIKPICLPFSVDDLTNLGKKLFVSGWGLTEKKAPSPVKLKVQVPVKALSDCVNALKSVFNINVELDEGHICAGGEEGKDSCKGDSGGPLMALKVDNRKNTQWFLIGIVSFGPTNPCGRKDKPAVYVRVLKYVDWIVKNLKP